ncbi:MAG: MFS transporter [Flavobacteriales bacterium]|nr:MFS transporter [Flavobacteriales bacterium]
MTSTKNTIWLTVLVASLGYFVDIYDLQLFNIVSKQSIRGLGITDPAWVDKYDYTLFLWQMTGMLVGGLFWGVIGDTKGRKNILFGSILIYSLANLANAFVGDMTQYSIVRFIAGLGLAGELGAAITLVSEIMHKEKRGYGTMLIVTMGALGAVAAALISKMKLEWAGLQNWQVMYVIGGSLGLLLLVLRMGTFESGMFDEVKKSNVSKGNFFILLRQGKRLRRYIASILIGLPVWYSIGVLIKFSEKFAITNQVQGEPVNIGFAIMYAYIGLSFGDLLSGLLSQLFRSRKKIVYLYLFFTVVVTLLFLYLQNMSTSTYYLFCFLIGTATGYWALFVTMASESFGTNIRATVTTTVPNFVRGAVVPITLSYKSLELSMGNINSALIVGIVCIGLAFISLSFIPETFGKDMQFTET